MNIQKSNSAKNSFSFWGRYGIQFKKSFIIAEGNDIDIFGIWQSKFLFLPDFNRLVFGVRLLVIYTSNH